MSLNNCSLPEEWKRVIIVPIFKSGSRSDPANYRSHQVGVPGYIQWMVYMVAVIIPMTQLFFSLVCVALGCVCFYFTAQSLIGSKVGSRERLVKKKLLKRESEALIEYD